jgi:O-antigen/teichoic acid export membrane protein
MIVSMVGAAANGLYAAAHKIPSLLSVVVSIFFQAWQMSANEEFKKKDIAGFYSKIFEQISACIFLLSSVLIVFSRPINSIFLGEDYGGAWVFMPPLVLSMTFFSYAQFLGSIYSANKKTNMALVTNLVGVVVNVSLNAVLIPLIGTIGAAAATAISYLVLWVIRIVDTGKIVPMQYKTVSVVAASLIVIAQTIFVCLDLDLIVTYSVCAVGTVILVAMYRRTLVTMVKFFLGLAKKILKRR